MTIFRKVRDAAIVILGVYLMLSANHYAGTDSPIASLMPMLFIAGLCGVIAVFSALLIRQN